MDIVTVNPPEWKDLEEITENEKSITNIQYVKKGNLLIFAIDLNQPLNSPSASGKTMAIASTGGMIRWEGKLLNIWFGRKL